MDKRTFIKNAGFISLGSMLSLDSITEFFKRESGMSSKELVL